MLISYRLLKKSAHSDRIGLYLKCEDKSILEYAIDHIEEVVHGCGLPQLSRSKKVIKDKIAEGLYVFAFFLDYYEYDHIELLLAQLKAIRSARFVLERYAFNKEIERILKQRQLGSFTDGRYIPPVNGGASAPKPMSLEDYRKQVKQSYELPELPTLQGKTGN